MDITGLMFGIAIGMFISFGVYMIDVIRTSQREREEEIKKRRQQRDKEQLFENIEKLIDEKIQQGVYSRRLDLAGTNFRLDNLVDKVKQHDELLKGKGEKAPAVKKGAEAK